MDDQSSNSQLTTDSTVRICPPHLNPFIESVSISAPVPVVQSVVHPMPQYRIRRMKVEDVPAVLEIWAQNDLHEGIYTIQSFMQVDPDGFVVAVEVDDDDNDDLDDVTQQQPNGGGLHKIPELAIPEESSEDEDEEINNNNNNSGNKIGNLFQKKQICCCSVQAPNSPPPPPPLLQNHNYGSTSKSVSLQTFKKTEKRVLGMCSGVFVHPSIAFIGLYGVRPELHGRGIGMSMWNRIMEHIGSANAGLYAVTEHLKMYRDRAGFRSPDERLLFIYESSGSEKQELNTDLLVDSIRGIEICPVTDKLYDQVIRYDADIHGYSREKLLPSVCKEKGSVALVALDVEEEDEQSGDQFCIQGYGCIRTNNIGKAMIGPLYASNDAVAELLMRRLFDALPGPFYNGLLYMTLDSNPGGERIAEKLGLVKHEELPRYFLRAPYKEAKWTQVYCVHSPNFSLL